MRPQDDGAPEPDCPFCDIPEVEVVRRSASCVALWTGEPPEGSVMVVPVAHRRTPFELTPQEWAETRELLVELQADVAVRHAPDGWTVGWNVGAVAGQSVAHVHCHLVPRHRDEPYAGRGLRWWLKRPENSRPQRPLA